MPVDKVGPGNAVPGVIDSLSTGFDQINKITWVLIAPIVVDLVLWLAPRISIAPVLLQLATWYDQLIQQYSAIGGQAVDQSTLDQAKQVAATIRDGADAFNLLTVLTLNGAAVPSITPANNGGIWLTLTSPGTVLAAAIGLELVGTWIGCFFLGCIAQQVRDGHVSLGFVFRRTWFYWISVIGFLVLLALVTVAVLIPIGLIGGAVELIAPGGGTVLLGIIALLMPLALVMLVVYLFFLLDAIVVSQAGPIRAAATSIRLVANNFWPSVGFIILFFVISWGMQIIWNALEKQPWGVALAIIGNGYVASGLAAGSMVFYRTRQARLPAAAGALDRSPRV